MQLWQKRQSHSKRQEEEKKKKRGGEQAIFEGLNWLGLEGDEPAIYQSHNINRHKQVANELAASGAAYYCYLSLAEIETLRAENKQDGTPFRSPWRVPSYNGDKNQKPVLLSQALNFCLHYMQIFLSKAI